MVVGVATGSLDLDSVLGVGSGKTVALQRYLE